MIALYIAITIGTFLFMEFVAWAAHKYVMHGFLWYLHKDHHQREPGFFEKNDAFFLIFAAPSATCFIVGSAIEGWFPLFFVGVGIALYGIAYFLVHDIFIHQRFKISFRRNRALICSASLRGFLNAPCGAGSIDFACTFGPVGPMA